MTNGYSNLKVAILARQTASHVASKFMHNWIISWVMSMKIIDK